MTTWKSTATRVFSLATTLALFFVMATGVFAEHEKTHSMPFQGVKANKGSVMLMHEGNKTFLMLSDDFVVPDTPDPHWQVIDSKGMPHLLQALKVKDGKSNRRIELPKHVPDVAKVQIWCAFAETVLGEAGFPKPLK